MLRICQFLSQTDIRRDEERSQIHLETSKIPSIEMRFLNFLERFEYFNLAQKKMALESQNLEVDHLGFERLKNTLSQQFELQVFNEKLNLNHYSTKNRRLDRNEQKYYIF